MQYEQIQSHDVPLMDWPIYKYEYTFIFINWVMHAGSHIRIVSFSTQHWIATQHYSLTVTLLFADGTENYIIVLKPLATKF